MADNESNTPEPTIGGAPEDTTQPTAGMITQYVKDLSFENPNAPTSMQILAGKGPNIDVNVNVNVKPVQQDVYEVELKFTVTGKIPMEEGEDMVAFVCELAYGALFGIRGLDENAMKAFCLISAPTLMFPFARRVIADATRDGGFPPLILEPINFQALVQQQMAQQQAGQDGGISMAEMPSDATVN